jgi:GTP-binding protein
VLGELATDTTDISLVLFSALSRQGLGDAALVLRQWQATAVPGDAAAADGGAAPAAEDPAPPLSPA